MGFEPGLQTKRCIGYKKNPADDEWLFMWSASVKVKLENDAIPDVLYET